MSPASDGIVVVPRRFRIHVFFCHKGTSLVSDTFAGNLHMVVPLLPADYCQLELVSTSSGIRLETIGNGISSSPARL
jgi:hypothetical protein